MGQVLSEGEVDALLKGVGDGEVETETDQADDEKGVTKYDLTSQEKLLQGDFLLWILSIRCFLDYFAKRFLVCYEKP